MDKTNNLINCKKKLCSNFIRFVWSLENFTLVCGFCLLLLVTNRNQRAHLATDRQTKQFITLWHVRLIMFSFLTITMIAKCKLALLSWFHILGETAFSHYHSHKYITAVCNRQKSLYVVKWKKKTFADCQLIVPFSLSMFVTILCLSQTKYENG